jgi:hypothetical protein
VRRIRVLLAAALAMLALAPTELVASVQDVVDQVSTDAYRDVLDNHLNTHAGNNRGFTLSGSPRIPDGQHDATRDYIRDQMTSYGLSTSLDPFSFNSFGIPYSGAANVIGVKTGVSRPGDIYIVGCHYDSVQNPGADDNASGVAGVLEAARVLSPYNFAATLVFVAFDGEEKGLYGSWHYADGAAGQQILGMVCLDMIAYNPAGDNKAYVYGRTASDPIKQALADAMAVYSGIAPVIGGDEPYSDHAPFEADGYQACLLIEHAVWSNSIYHTSLDSVDTAGYIDYAYAADMVRGTVGYLASAAGLTPEPATLLLLAAGTVLVAARRSRQSLSPQRTQRAQRTERIK